MTYLHILTPVTKKHAPPPTPTLVHTLAHKTHSHKCTHTHTLSHKHTHTHTLTHACDKMHDHLHTHTHTHTHTQSNICTDWVLCVCPHPMWNAQLPVWVCPGGWEWPWWGWRRRGKQRLGWLGHSSPPQSWNTILTHYATCLPFLYNNNKYHKAGTQSSHIMPPACSFFIIIINAFLMCWIPQWLDMCEAQNIIQATLQQYTT